MSSSRNTVVTKRGTSYMSKIGRKGGSEVVRRYGSNYMSLLGTLGANAVNNNLSKTRRLRIEREIRSILAQ